MRIALISDIHGNEVALSAVLDDINQNRVDEIICLGDVATLGPHPGAIIQVLQELKCKCIKGNHDDFLINPDLIHEYTEVPIILEAVDWCRDQLSTENLDFIRSFQPTFEISLGIESSLFLFHGSPNSNMENILSTTSPDDLERVLYGYCATVIAGGHTHIQMLRQHRGTLIVNPGSVGLPFKEYVAGQQPTLLNHAEYAIVEADNDSININLRRVNVDKVLLRETIAMSKIPIRSMLLSQYT
jgi:predicted phosphodiesterase